MPVRIKVCGITNTADAIAAVEAGADALGFIFYEGSKRFLTPENARSILRDLPPFVSKVGLFVNATADTISRTIEETGIDTIQLHGEETPEACRGFPVKTIKAFRVQGKDMLALMPRYDVDAWLLDSFSAAARGGTGETFDWDLAVHACSLGTPVILAGGLNPHNIAAAISRVQPFAVDVSSGVELSPGRKDHQKIAEFIANARAAGNLV